MANSFLGQKRLRKYYGKIREVLEMPNLIEVQKSSYDLFLKSGDTLEPLDGEGNTILKNLSMMLRNASSVT
jgi:DNA-directed RNA polymerase subunit beta